LSREISDEAGADDGTVRLEHELAEGTDLCVGAIAERGELGCTGVAEEQR
jgi:hypothetical protein